jgi:hypothetical protein
MEMSKIKIALGVALGMSVAMPMAAMVLLTKKQLSPMRTTGRIRVAITATTVST